MVDLGGVLEDGASRLRKVVERCIPPQCLRKSTHHAHLGNGGEVTSDAKDVKLLFIHRDKCQEMEKTYFFPSFSASTIPS